MSAPLVDTRAYACPRCRKPVTLTHIPRQPRKRLRKSLRWYHNRPDLVTYDSERQWLVPRHHNFPGHACHASGWRVSRLDLALIEEKS